MANNPSETIERVLAHAASLQAAHDMRVRLEEVNLELQKASSSPELKDFSPTVFEVGELQGIQRSYLEKSLRTFLSLEEQKEDLQAVGARPTHGHVKEVYQRVLFHALQTAFPSELVGILDNSTNYRETKFVDIPIPFVDYEGMVFSFFQEKNEGLFRKVKSFVFQKNLAYLCLNYAPSGGVFSLILNDPLFLVACKDSLLQLQEKFKDYSLEVSSRYGFE